VTIAGNAFAYLTIPATRPGELQCRPSAHPKGFSCDADDPEIVSGGGIDLRFHEGNFDAKPFPTGTPTQVRIDLYNLALRLEAGDSLAFVARTPNDRDTREFAPTITISAGSQLVLPIVDGTLGGGPPTLPYPDRPF
jgi:hypothetical protein